VNRILRNVSPNAALDRQRSLRRELQDRLRDLPRTRVVDFGRYWLSIKRKTIDPGTYDRYEAALEEHAFKALGRIEFAALQGLSVQGWINDELLAGYSVATVKGWFRVFRTMVQDAVEDLTLPRDATRRIHFPPVNERAETNALLPRQLEQFLAELERRYPQHFALAATLAYTGLRFCHASGLRWEDFDAKARILHVRRRQLRGRVGRVSLVKRAPKQYPVPPQLMAILIAHRDAGRRSRPRRRGWMFPNRNGGLRSPSSLQKAWQHCLKIAKVRERFTIHGLRRTFVDLSRRAKVDPVVTQSLTGHVTMKMHLHYSSVALDEKRAAVAAIAALIRGGDPGGDRERIGWAARRASRIGS
jgi:integrase